MRRYRNAAQQGRERLLADVVAHPAWALQASAAMTADAAAQLFAHQVARSLGTPADGERGKCKGRPVHARLAGGAQSLAIGPHPWRTVLQITQCWNGPWRCR